MLKSKTKFFAGLALALSVAFSVSYATQAAAQTALQPGQHQLPKSCLPDFDSNTHVYVSPELRNSATSPETLEGLEKRLAPLAAQHGLQVFVIDCEAKYDWKLPAVDLATTVSKQWQPKPGFNADKFLIITQIHQQGSAVHMSTAAIGGSYLQKYGFGPAVMGAASGPVAKDREQFRDNAVERFAKIVRYINAGIDQVDANRAAAAERQAAAEKAAADHARTMARLPYQLALAFLLIGLAIGGFVQRRRYNAHKAPALAKLTAWKSKHANANTSLVGFTTKYLDFFKAQGTDWLHVFTGETLIQYTAATSAYDDMNIRTTFSRQRLEDAEKAYNSGSFFSFAGFDTALALLTTVPVTVTGKALADEALTMFGPATDDKTFQPDELLANLEELFTTANSKAAKIMSAFSGADANKTAIETERTEIEGIRDAIVAKGLSFAPYQPNFDKIETAQKAFMAVLSADPVGAFAQSEAVQQETLGLVAELRRASAILESVAPAEKEVAAAANSVATTRQKDVDSSFPGETGTFANAKFSLDEANGNPDALLTTAQEHLVNARQNLVSGHLDDAETEVKSAVAAAKSASELADRTVAAKAEIEKTVTSVRDAMAQLKAETPAAEQALKTLTADFSLVNYSANANAAAQAKLVVGNVKADLDEVRQNYFAQQFIAGSAKVDSIGAAIAAARDGLAAVHAKLATLTEKRDHSRSTAKAARALADALFEKLSANTVSTAAATMKSYNDAVPSLPSIETDVAQATTDWLVAADAADRLLSVLKTVDAEIEQSSKDWQTARVEVSKLDAAVRSAYQAVSQSGVREGAAQKYSEAQAVHEQLSAQIVLAQQNWTEIASRATAATAVAVSAANMAVADVRIGASYNAAAAQVNSVSTQNQLGGFGIGVYADLDYATNSLNQAMAAWNSGDYAQAERLANQANEEAAEAHNDAVRQAAINAAAILAAEVEAERRRTVIVTGGFGTNNGSYQTDSGNYQSRSGDSGSQSSSSKSDDDDSGSNAGGNDDNSSGGGGDTNAGGVDD